MPRSKKQQSDRAERVLEQGDIFFLYRPKVSENEAGVSGKQDIQRLYLVLKPQGKRRYRLIAVPRKQLPDTRKGQEKFWGFVDQVSTRSSEMGVVLGSTEYRTATRGKRVQPEVRPAGEGVYAITQHGDHTHLAYLLELPDLLGEVQQALNITEEASYIISVKNPEQPAPEGLGLDEPSQADFPKKLQERFRGRRFIPVVPPEFLNYKGAELLLIGSAGDTFEDLGIELQGEKESESTAEIFRDLRLEKSQRTTAPLLEGKWA